MIEHSCDRRVLRNKTPHCYEAPVLARIIAPKLRVSPKMEVVAIQQELFRYVRAKVTYKFAQKVKSAATELIHGTVADSTAKLDSFAQLLNSQGHYCKIFWVTRDEAVKAIRRGFDQRREKFEKEESRKPPEERKQWTYSEPDFSGMRLTDRLALLRDAMKCFTSLLQFP